MTEKTYKKLKNVRDRMSIIGWFLMVCNLFVCVFTVISSLVRHIPVLSHEIAMIVVFVTSTTVGLLAVIDMAIYRRIRRSEIVA